ncbi:MAG: 50S ribosomal protein L30 [Candidatus Krumholzibacteriota bacterium]|jgi:large subunit ribosomal protein L30|nr:50S ribosomal protein L30 [Candidatus Krumholzibacteriota bacterium]
MAGKLKVTQIRSCIGYKEPAKRTIRALGLKRMHHTVVHEDTPQIRGMIFKVKHMVRVEPVEE